MLLLKRVWCFLTRQKLVCLLDHDGEVTFVPAKKTPFGYVAKRHWPHNRRIVHLKDDHTVEHGRYVCRWADA